MVSLGKKIFLILIFLIASLLLLFGCTFFGGSSPSGDDSNSVTFQSAVLSGYVFDQKGVAVSDAEVLLDGVKQTLTDSAGFYKFEVSLGENKLVSFKKEGFVAIHKSLDFTFKTEKYLEVTMFPQAEFKLVDSSKESKVEMNNAALTTDASGFVVKGTQTVVDKASVSLTPFDPANSEEVKAFPGEFSGTKMDGSTTSIESFGFMKIEALTEDGKQLDIAKGKTATVKQPISAELVSSAPESIPLWYFDEKQNTWVEKGVAEKVCVANECYYEGKIDTIGSWWNCDQPQNTSKANCNGSSGKNAKDGKAKSFKDLMKKLGEKAGMWALNKALGHVPVVGAFYGAARMANNVINELSGSGPLSDRVSAASKTALIWAGRKLIGQVSGAAGLSVDVAMLAVDVLKEVKNYAQGLFNNQYDASCNATGTNYRGSSSSNISPNMSPIDLTSGQTNNQSNSSNQNEVLVRSNSQADITINGLDMTSESIQIITGDTGKSVDVPVDDFAAVSVPIEINPSGPGVSSRVEVTFTNKEGKKTTLSKTLSNTKPIAFMSILIRPDREGTIEVKGTSFMGKYYKKYSVPALNSGDIHEIEEQQIDVEAPDINRPDLNITYLEECPYSLYGYMNSNDLNRSFSCGCSGERASYLYGSVYGTDVYYVGSDVCRAGVHSGVIDQNGGFLLFTIKGDVNEFISSRQNGVVSNSSSHSDYSFVFETPKKYNLAVEDLGVCPSSLYGFMYGYDLNHSFSCGCSGERASYLYGSVYGTDVYYVGSDVCRAGVHAGVIDRNGGEVFFTIGGDVNGFVSSRRNWIVSSGTGASDFSFVFDMPVKYSLGVEDLNVCPSSLYGFMYGYDLNHSFSCGCSGKRASYLYESVYGSGPYYVGSDVCRAGVHAGVIDQSGGRVLFTIQGPESSFPSSQQNGITSSSTGASDYSFVFGPRQN